MDQILHQHSGELTIAILGALLFVTLLILVPQLLRSHQKSLELQHTEHMRSLEQGLPITRSDDRSILAGRTALLVPIVAICTAGTVTCFLAAYRSELIFSVALAVWSVAGIISLAAITGCVALLGRLAQLQSTKQEEDFETNPLGK
jgi:hypothetical protein